MQPITKRPKSPELSAPQAAALAVVATRTRDYFDAADAKNTARAYATDWRAYEAWTTALGVDPLDARSVALYVGAVGKDLAPATVARRVAGISRAFKAQGLDAPTQTDAVRRVMKGFRRAAADEGRTAQNRKAPVVGPELRAMLGGLGAEVLGVRDRALILLGFHGGFRRAELVALDVADVTFEREGLRVRIKRSKTDQTGTGRDLGVLYQADAGLCAVRALREWLDRAAITEGPIFRPVTRHGKISRRRLCAESVAIVVKRRARAAGLDADRYAGHSLRSGLVTTAALSGASERAIANQTGHRSMPILRRYIRAASVFEASENVGAALRI